MRGWTFEIWQLLLAKLILYGWLFAFARTALDFSLGHWATEGYGLC